MISNFKKLNFCNFSAHLTQSSSPHTTPSFFPFRGAFYAVGIPNQIPGIFPSICPFRGHPLPIIFPVSSCLSVSQWLPSGVLLPSNALSSPPAFSHSGEHPTQQKLPIISRPFPVCPPFQVDSYGGEIYAPNLYVSIKIESFQQQIIAHIGQWREPF